MEMLLENNVLSYELNLNMKKLIYVGFIFLLFACNSKDAGDCFFFLMGACLPGYCPPERPGRPCRRHDHKGFFRIVPPYRLPEAGLR